ncbi:MAG: type II secretion system F family protein [Coriobacteriales bacterium]|jgi:tight adherence protein B|nr:type II secretion system F family protein [Coriobacteriales bacterium]
MVLSSDALILGAMISGAFSAILISYYLFASLQRFLKRVAVSCRITGSSAKSLPEAICDALLRNGIAPLRWLAARLLHLSLARKTVEDIRAWAAVKFAAVTTQAISECLLCVSLVVSVLMLLFTGEPILALIVPVVPILIFKSKATRWATSQNELMREQLPDALVAIGMCFSAGYSLEQALAQTAKETPEPLAAQLRRTASDMQAGCSVTEALRQLESRIQLPDLRFVSTALEIQHQTGGSLRDILEGTAQSINASFELHRSLKVQTAQAKMSARVVSIMPIALVAMLSLCMDGYLARFFTSFEGFCLLLVAACMEVTGIVLIRKILAINLD